MSDLQELKQKIIKYVPEILIPCRYCGGSGMNYFINPENGEQEREYCSYCQGCGYEGERPITLEDVLIVLSKKYGEWHCTFWGNNVCHIDEGIDWIPNKPLHEQSEETIELLNEIIV